VLSQDDLGRGLLLLHRDTSWSELRDTLKLARACVQEFTKRYRYFDDEENEHVWATLERAEVEHDAEAFRAANGLPTHRVDEPDEIDEADD
jgi:hypothetical protein